MTSIKPLLGEGRVRGRNDCAEGIHKERWCAQRISFDHSRWTCEETHLRWSAPSHLFVLTEQGRSAHTQVSSEGKHVYCGRDLPGALTFVPAGIERVATYRNVDLVYSALWIATTIDLDGYAHTSLPLIINGQDAVIGSLIRSINTELCAGHRPDDVYIEHVAAVIMLRVARLARTASTTTKPGRLSPALLKKLDEFVTAHLDSRIALSDLAALASMKTDTFARHFKATTGKPPYEFVLEHRVRCAERLLVSSHLPLAQISAAAGFASQSHLTSVFQRMRGTTPAKYRARHLFPDPDIRP